MENACTQAIIFSQKGFERCVKAWEKGILKAIKL